MVKHSWPNTALGLQSMSAENIEWLEPWRPIQFAVEIPGVQRQLEQEISERHPLYGSNPVAVGRRIDCDDIVARLSNGTYANVHLVWGGPGPGAFPEQYPSWFLYGSLENFVGAMREDATEYGCE